MLACVPSSFWHTPSPALADSKRAPRRCPRGQQHVHSPQQAPTCAVLLVRLVAGIDTRALVALATPAAMIMGFVMFLPRIGGPLGHGGVARDRAPASASPHAGRPEPAAKRVHPSPCERTASNLLMQGKTAAQVGESLFISNGAVRAHCSRIYTKFGVRNRKALDEAIEGPQWDRSRCGQGLCIERDGFAYNTSDHPCFCPKEE